MKSSNRVVSKRICQEVLVAVEQLRPHVVETPLIPSAQLSAKLGNSVYLKLENRQHTGSFKLRGATNKILSLSDAERARGIVTASTGNHGLAVGHAASRLGVSATIYLPESAAPDKVKKLGGYDVTLQFVEGDAVNAEITARRVSEEASKPFISPYNDLRVMAGQGTVGEEILRQKPGLDTVFVAVGGGGLAGGIASYLKTEKPEVEIVGCLPLNSPVMAESVRRGEIVDIETIATLSDGTAGGIEPGAISFPVVRALVDRWLLVTEEQIADAVRLVHRLHGERIEGAAGVAVASMLLELERDGRGPAALPAQPPKTVAAIICGGNIGDKTFKEIIGGQT